MKEAWMFFLSSISLQDILELCGICPEFIPIYEHIFSFRKDVRVMVDMYTEALRIMNHNTELYMIEEKERQIDELQKQMADMQKQMAERDTTMADMQKQMAEKDRLIKELLKQTDDKP